MEPMVPLVGWSVQAESPANGSLQLTLAALVILGAAFPRGAGGSTCKMGNAEQPARRSRSTE